MSTILVEDKYRKLVERALYGGANASSVYAMGSLAAVDIGLDRAQEIAKEVGFAPLCNYLEVLRERRSGNRIS